MLGKVLKALWDIFVILIKFIFSKGKFGGKTISSAVFSIVEGDWKQIDVDLKSNSPAVLKSALIKADKSLDNLLKELVHGNTMGERMIAGKNKFSPDVYSSIWSAHKVRNAMVHESGYEPTYYILQEAISNLRKGVKQLGARV
jgi:hypothetical protein